jgi:hypothetical protein
MSTPRRYHIDDIRSKFQTVALSNHYQVFFETNASILQAASRRGIDNRFVVEDLGLYVSDAVLPGSSFADIEVAGDRQGITERFPQNRIYDDVTFSFYVDRDYNVLKFFETWSELINPLRDGANGINPDVMRLTYPKFYKCNISIHKFNKDNFTGPDPSRNAIAYTFINAWPYSIASTPVSYSGSNILQMNVTFRYDRYTVMGVTVPQPITSGTSPTDENLDPGASQTPIPTGGSSSSQIQKRLIPISPGAAGTSGVVFYDANVLSKTQAIIQRSYVNSAGDAIY